MHCSIGVFTHTSCRHLHTCEHAYALWGAVHTERENTITNYHLTSPTTICTHPDMLPYMSYTSCGQHRESHIELQIP